MFHVPNKNRLTNHFNKSINTTDQAGNNGVFVLNHKGYDIYCIASDGLGWEHVSVTINKKRTPQWDLMCYIKSVFWDDGDCVIQYHPPESVYVNNHPYCLHLWRPVNKKIPVPDPKLLGFKL